MIFQITVIVLILNTSVIKSSSISIRKIDCVNPPETQLNKQYASAYSQYIKQNKASKLAIYHSGEVYQNELADSSDLSQVYYLSGHQVCGLNEQTRWDLNYNAMCPHHFVVEVREDRYPFKRTKASCNCERCLGLSDLDFKYSCLPTYYLEPVLVKGECMSNGFFKWTAKYELVANGCKCDFPIKTS